jgi:hypothetical protein
MNGYEAEETVNAVADILPWLQEAIAHFYPDCEYSQSLDPAIKVRAAYRAFVPPGTGAQVQCPHCGAPHANPGGFDQLIAFNCLHCGKFVKVEPPKVQ